MKNKDHNHTIYKILALETIGIQNQSNKDTEIFRQLIEAGILTNSLDFTELGQKLVNLILIDQNKGKFKAILKQIDGFEKRNEK